MTFEQKVRKKLGLMEFEEELGILFQEYKSKNTDNRFLTALEMEKATQEEIEQQPWYTYSDNTNTIKITK